MKKLLAAVVAAALLTLPVHATFEQDVENSSQIFAERFSAPTWLLQDCQAKPGSKIVLKSKEYNVSFYSEDITNIIDGPRYSLPFEFNDNKMIAAEYDNWVGPDTPKLAFTFAPNAQLPGKTYVTINDTNFAPYSSLYLYERTGFYNYRSITSGLKVESDGSVTLPVTAGGDFLLSARQISENVNPYDYERPSMEEVMAGAGFTASKDPLKKNPSTGAAL